MKKTFIALAIASAAVTGQASAALGVTGVMDMVKADQRFQTGDDVVLTGNRIEGIHGAKVQPLDPHSHPKGMFRVDHADGTQTYHSSSTQLNVIQNGRTKGTISDGGTFDGAYPAKPAEPPMKTEAQRIVDNAKAEYVLEPVPNTSTAAPATSKGEQVAMPEVHQVVYTKGESVALPEQKLAVSAPQPTASTTTQATPDAVPTATPSKKPTPQATPQATPKKVPQPVKQLTPVKVSAQPSKQLVSMTPEAAARQRETFQTNAIATNRSQSLKNANDIVALDNKVDDLRKDLEKQGKRLNGIGALAVANSQLIQPYNVGNVNVSVGMGNYEGANAVAVGSGMRINENWTVRASASYEDATETMAFGAGAAYEF